MTTAISVFFGETASAFYCASQTSTSPRPLDNCVALFSLVFFLAVHSAGRACFSLVYVDLITPASRGCWSRFTIMFRRFRGSRFGVVSVPAAMVELLEFLGKAIAYAYHPNRILAPDGLMLPPELHGRASGPRVLAWIHKSDQRDRESATSVAAAVDTSADTPLMKRAPDNDIEKGVDDGDYDEDGSSYNRNSSYNHDDDNSHGDSYISYNRSDSNDEKDMSCSLHAISPGKTSDGLDKEKRKKNAEHDSFNSRAIRTLTRGPRY
ncbi:hypothetical protein GMORB2_0776 [Geosmithia morbida]|uniref:Uncharacterized protein n=1 Tax=Geosmithia morbida TaxID=1094350 RepID=A0A9P4YZR7_9HYPO|nr:uncharacterized protein GMORB2_0776 [Geosmithia morbida]KAF4125532.1 hypothetical protein GMORB2_0776 [Geosmithia morbida]